MPLPYPEAVQAPIHEQDIADVAVIALTGDTLIGQAPVLTGPDRLTLRQQVDTIGEAIDRTVAVAEQTETESTTLLTKYVPEVWVQQIVKDWRKAVGATPAISGEYELTTGMRSRTWVEENADLFR